MPRQDGSCPRHHIRPFRKKNLDERLLKLNTQGILKVLDGIERDHFYEGGNTQKSVLP